MADAAIDLFYLDDAAEADGPSADAEERTDVTATDSAASARPDASADVPPAEAAGTCPRRNDLVLCLRFEGTVEDESPARLAIGPTMLSFADGPSGGAADVGPTTQITMADSPLFYGPTISIEAWVNPRALTHDAFIVDHQGHYSLVVHADGSVACVAGTSSASRPAALHTGTWTSIACTFDRSSVALWLDGVKSAGEPGVGASTDSGPSRLTVAWGGPPERSFEGLVDNVRVWRTVRTAGELCSSVPHCGGSETAASDRSFDWRSARP